MARSATLDARVHGISCLPLMPFKEGYDFGGGVVLYLVFLRRAARSVKAA